MAFACTIRCIQSKLRSNSFTWNSVISCRNFHSFTGPSNLNWEFTSASMVTRTMPSICMIIQCSNWPRNCASYPVCMSTRRTMATGTATVTAFPNGVRDCRTVCPSKCIAKIAFCSLFPFAQVYNRNILAVDRTFTMHRKLLCTSMVPLVFMYSYRMRCWATLRTIVCSLWNAKMGEFFWKLCTKMRLTEINCLKFSHRKNIFLETFLDVLRTTQTI